MKLKMIHLVALLVLFISYSSANYDYSVPPHGSRTGYNVSFTAEELKLIARSEDYVPDVCTPIHLATSLRHGSRYPGSYTSMRELTDKLRGKVNNAQYAEINDSYITFPDSEADLISSQGRLDMQEVAGKYAEKFRELLSGSRASEISFSSSSPLRVYASAEEFQRSLAEALGADINQKIAVRDDILRFWDDCPYWEESIIGNSTVMQDYTEYKEGPELEALGRILTERLQLKQGITLTADDVVSAWDIAGNEVQIYGDSAYDRLMSWEEQDTVQYLDDLYQYVARGYGHPVSPQISCELLSEIFGYLDDSLEAHSQGYESWMKATFRFVHHFTNRPLQSLLGLNKDDVPLRADNYHYQQLNRLYRCDRTNPVAAAVTMVIYSCDTDAEITNSPPLGVEWPKSIEPYMIQLLNREIPVKFPICDTHFCDYKYIRNHYDDIITGCNRDALCAL